jgi:hypothetical protein
MRAARYHGLRRTFWLAKKDGGDFEVGTDLVFQKVFEFSAAENIKLQRAREVQLSAFPSGKTCFLGNPVLFCCG